MKKKIEILAPAKDLIQGIAAINSGADAVYIGAPLYGARSNATNSIEDIAELVKYAHLFNAQVLQLVNSNRDLAQHPLPATGLEPTTERLRPLGYEGTL